MRTLVDDRLKCVFIHIPKNAGISIWNTIGGCRKDSYHVTVGEVKQHLPSEIFDKYTKFAIVRNTYTRLCSMYAYYFIQNKIHMKYSDLHIYSFKDFIMNLGSIFSRDYIDTWFYHKVVEFRQFDWISIDGVLSVDRTLRFEYLKEDFDQLQEDSPYNKRFTLRHDNSTNIDLNPLMEQFDDEMLEKVAQYYAQDLNTFDHTFNV